MTDEFIECLTSLDAGAKEIVKFKLLYPRATHADVGRHLGVTRQAIYDRFQKNENLKKCFEIIENDIVRQIKDLFPMAVLAIIRGLKSKEDRIAAQTGLKVLGSILEKHPALMPDTLEDEGLSFIYDDDQPKALKLVDNHETDPA